MLQNIIAQFLTFYIFFDISLQQKTNACTDTLKLNTSTNMSIKREGKDESPLSNDNLAEEMNRLKNISHFLQSVIHSYDQNMDELKRSIAEAMHELDEKKYQCAATCYECNVHILRNDIKEFIKRFTEKAIVFQDEMKAKIRLNVSDLQ